MTANSRRVEVTVPMESHSLKARNLVLAREPHCQFVPLSRMYM